MIQLSIHYSKEFEVKRIQNTIKRLNWYLSNRYDLRLLSFPKNIEIERLKELSEVELLKLVEGEYDEGKFASDEESIRHLYSAYEVKLENFIKSINVPVLPDIQVYLTQYGIGGSYSLPNEVIVNTSRFFNIGLIRNVLHEIIHLHIQHLIDRYAIGQWEKEALVALLFEKAFSEIYKANFTPIDANIRESFAKYFPDIEKIISLSRSVSAPLLKP